MGIRDEIQIALTEAFADELIDVVSEFDVYKSIEGGVYNVETGKRDKISTTPSPSKGIFGVLKSNEIDGDKIKSTDEKLTINGSDISVELSINDIIVTRKNGFRYLVVDPRPIMGGDSEVIIYAARVRKNG